MLLKSEVGENSDFTSYAQENNINFKKQEVEIGYDQLNYTEVLRELLPPDVEVPGGFEAIGEIAHMNLWANQLPFKYEIGQAVLDKNPTMKTVVTKIGHINSTYRFYDLQCIGGAMDYETTVVEDKVRLRVDVSKMYWCSKLATERTRLIQEYLKDGQVLCDMFCGVGPLAVKAAVKRTKLKVLANDLNPEGVEYLKKNIKLNKVGNRVLPFNMDAREFVKMLVDTKIDTEEKRAIPKEFLRFDHCFMNLPMDAVEFLDAFIGLYNNCDPEVWKVDGKAQLPLIHVYGFTQEAEKPKAKTFFAKRIAQAMQYPEFKEEDIICFHDIRDVSAISHMYSTTFRLPEAVAFADPKLKGEDATKRQKTE